MSALEPIALLRRSQDRCGQFVAHTVNRDDQAWVLGRVAEAAPNAPDVHVDGAPVAVKTHRSTARWWMIHDLPTARNRTLRDRWALSLFSAPQSGQRTWRQSSSAVPAAQPFGDRIG